MDSAILQKIGSYCAYQERSHWEVRMKLVELGARGDQLEEIINYLIENNFLNELRFAQHYVRGKFYSKKWGRNKILFELKAKKISTYCINKAMKEIDQNDYFEIAKDLIEKKWQQLQSNSLSIKKKKIYSYMLQKGYESNLIAEILREHFD